MEVFVFKSEREETRHHVVAELSGDIWMRSAAAVIEERGDGALTLSLPSDGAALLLAEPFISSDPSFEVSAVRSVASEAGWEDWTPEVREPESLEVANEALPAAALAGEEILAEPAWIVRWDWGWIWDTNASTLTEGPSAEAPSGTEGVGKWVWGAVRFVWRTAGRVSLDDPRVYAGIKVAEYAGRWAYRSYRAEQVRARRQYRANELNRRLVLQAARERSARTTQGSPRERARWNEYYHRVDKMIEASR